MILRKSASFLTDVEEQAEWYLTNAGLEIAAAYLQTVGACCHLIEKYPQLGPLSRFSHPKLKHWRFLVVAPPFQKHLLFYELAGEDVVLRRAMHGHRNLPKRLLKGK
jgi:toxin ParE1/3/4